MKRFNCVIFAFLFLFIGCNGNKNNTSKEKITITVTNNGWDSQKIHNAIAKIIVENAFENYALKESSGSSTMNWQAIISGDIDLDIESWTENVVSYEDDVKNGDIVDVGILLNDSAQGLYVPRYVIEGDEERGIKAVAPDLKTVMDLKKYSEFFPDDEDKTKGKLYGSLPGWMSDEILYKKYEVYGLNEFYNYSRLGSEATLFASLQSAYNLGEPWVGYCYEPTWVSGKLDIVLLEDNPYDAKLFLEGKTAFSSQPLKIVSNNKFADKAPDLLEFFKNYKTSSKLIAESLAYLDETKKSYEDLAKWFLTTNDYLLDDWLPSDQAKKVRDYLKQ